jgi:transcriptional regulator with XRE-family HTH domain
MELFKSNKIIVERDAIAEALKTARQRRRLKIKDVAKKLSINQKYLEALEAGRIGDLPPGVYQKNILKEYALFLHLNPKDILQAFEKEKTAIPRTDIFSTRKVKKHELAIVPKYLKTFAIIITVVLCFAYLAIALGKIVAPPFLEVTSPISDMEVSGLSLEIIGKTEPEAEVSINGRGILIALDGSFKQKIDLMNGLNEIEVSARRKFGRSIVITRRILAKY